MNEVIKQVHQILYYIWRMIVYFFKNEKQPATLTHVSISKIFNRCLSVKLLKIFEIDTSMLQAFFHFLD